uniref:receptor-like protein kinase FERONIA n=1 Tax=Erigeron canadensis TaxID=72917 RepID=UPI001CB98F97|nr:receptor-like protein kinase FERONIA [Erigeron canadensis]
MLNFSLLCFSLLIVLLFTTTIAQPYNATDFFLLDCGSSTATTSDRKWDGDDRSQFVPSNITTTSFSSATDNLDPSVPQIPYSTARIFNTSSFTYTFPVSQGPKFLRLYFYPATYSGLNANQSFFSVSSNGYTLLSNFSAFLTASYMGRTGGPRVPHIVKEFVLYVKDTQILNVTFTPMPNSYGFINGIEILSMPENLYFKSNNMKYVDQITGPVINEDVALENIYRLNVGGGQISVNNDVGMYRSWNQDNNYIYGAAYGLTPVTNTPIIYTMETPNYTAPELVYATQRSMGKLSELYNLTWILPVDSGFYYKLRLHFCNIIPQYTKAGQVLFTVYINNQTAEKQMDLFYLTPGSGYPTFKDYLVFAYDADGRQTKQDLWVAMHPNPSSAAYLDAYLNGLEVFKLSMDGNLASPNPELMPAAPLPRLPSLVDTKRTPPYAAIIGGIVGGLVFFTVLALVAMWKRQIKFFDIDGDKSSLCPTTDKSKSTKPLHPSLQSDRCRRFSLMEMKVATCEFNENCVIGKGGFGKVYKGYIDNATKIVAIKRLDSKSKQGLHEFLTEIGFLSKLRHVQLVSLIGYCNDKEEMILVYDFMAHGTLRDHLYKNYNTPLPWKKRLHICIGAAKGLQHLHTGASRVIMHRDIKSTNILLDENWVAKLSDFGLSKLGSKDKAKKHVTTMVKGTLGYMDPQYYQTEQITDKSDVYSFGVVLLEVLCARPPILKNKELPLLQVNLAEWGKSHYQKGTLHQIIDPCLSGEIAPKCLMKFGEVAYSCLKKYGSERPAMDDVVSGLEFALQLQEDAEKMDGMFGEAMLENQEVSVYKEGEPTTTDESGLFGSTRVALRHGTPSTDDSNKVYDSNNLDESFHVQN